MSYGAFSKDNLSTLVVAIFTKVKSKIPYLGEDGIVHYYDSETKTKDGVYVAMASFITSYARRVTITAFQKITDDYNSGKSNIRPIYADTDSLHIDSPNFQLPEGLDIGVNHLGTSWISEALGLRIHSLACPSCLIFT